MGQWYTFHRQAILHQHPLCMIDNSVFQLRLQFLKHCAPSSIEKKSNERRYYNFSSHDWDLNGYLITFYSHLNLTGHIIALKVFQNPGDVLAFLQQEAVTNSWFIREVSTVITPCSRRIKVLANGMIQWDDYFGKIRFIIAARRRMFICRRYG